jgi:hypothetical protein
MVGHALWVGSNHRHPVPQTELIRVELTMAIEKCYPAGGSAESRFGSRLSSALNNPKRLLEAFTSS